MTLFRKKIVWRSPLGNNTSTELTHLINRKYTASYIELSTTYGKQERLGQGPRDQRQVLLGLTPERSCQLRRRQLEESRRAVHGHPYDRSCC